MNNIIDYELRTGKVHGKKTLRHEAYSAIRLLIITLSLMILALSIVFLATTSESAQKGYLLEQLKLKNEKLKNEKNEVSAKVTNSTTFTNLEENKQIGKMQKSESKNYITEEDNRVK